MTQQEYDTAVAAFIRAKGVTRCPTVCATQTQASPAAADREALRQRAEERERVRQERRARAEVQHRFGIAA